jgi:hypothetical protein
LYGLKRALRISGNFGLVSAKHTADQWSKQEMNQLEKTTESPWRKPLKNAL